MAARPPDPDSTHTDEREIRPRSISSASTAAANALGKLSSHQPATSPGSSTTPHRRSISGGGILNRFPWVKSPQESASKAGDGDYFNARDPKKTAAVAAASALGGMSATSVQAKSSMRQRKGSLRKAAMLATGTSKANTAARRSSEEHTMKKSPTKAEPPKKFSFELPSENSSRDTLNALPSESHSISFSTTSSPVESRVTSPTNNGISSATDDDDTHRLQPTFKHISPPSPPSSESSAPVSPQQQQQQQARRRPISTSSSTRQKSPLAAPHTKTDYPPSEEEWDYTETAWWGWVVLVVTWIVFVVGMGSCLEVWSWAWDVGETPYAPPELEDDPTLPIVGYYPALMILTGVMSWVWVVVAWVGMKYFRHAKIQTED